MRGDDDGPETTLAAALDGLGARARAYAERVDRVTEADTIRALVVPLIDALGWPTDDLDAVRSEYRHRAGDGPVDLALMIDGRPALYVEAKPVQEALDDRRWIVQTLNYANASNVGWAVLTNGAEWRVYNVHAKAEPEEKLFFAARLDDADRAGTVRRLATLARARMTPERRLDALWRAAGVDAEMRRLIEGLPDNAAAVRALARASEGLSAEDVRDALRRLRLRADWSPIRVEAPLQVQAVAESDPDTPPITAAPAVERRARKKPVRMKTLIEAGLLTVGDTLRLRGFDKSDACLVDHKTVRWGGQLRSVNEWGCTVTRWSSINIYIHAETADGVLLDALRKRL